MVLVWISWRWNPFRRSLAALLLILAIISSLNAIFTTHSFLVKHFPLDRPLGAGLDFGFEEIVESIPGWVLPAVPPENAVPLQNPLGTHIITPDGLLIVNPDGPHPIFQLMRDAEAAWEAKLARASKTLDEAVREYKRRYHRPPPLGFDKWWDYVVKHNVQLPDEYDRIFNDIEVYWAFDHADLVRMQQESENTYLVAILEKTEDESKLQWAGSNIPKATHRGLEIRVEDFLVLVQDIEQDLPPLRFALAPLDNARIISDWRGKTLAREAAGNQTTISYRDLQIIPEKGWIQACPPDSPARLNPPVFPPFSMTPLPPAVQSSPKTFIASHQETMDPCLHPSLFTTNGVFLENPAAPGVRKVPVPLFTVSATKIHDEILLPVVYGWNYWQAEHENGAFEEDLAWEHKMDGRLDWRGSSTGIHASSKSLWAYAHRQRLVTLTNAFEGNASVLPVPKSGDLPVGDPETMPLAQLNEDWMDIAFAGQPFKCDKEICEEMNKLWKFQGSQGRGKEGQYKFIFDVDGNGWSGRFKRLITSNALIFKSTIYPEWFTSRIEPWVHFVPIQMSYTDLYDAVAFYRIHDELAAKIAKAGRDWSRKFWRREDMVAYIYRLLLEYGRVMSPNRASMNYDG